MSEVSLTHPCINGGAHHWLLDSLAANGFFQAHCQRCPATRAFPQVPVENRRQINISRKRPVEALKREAKRRELQGHFV